MKMNSGFVKGVMVFGFCLGLQLESRAAIYIVRPQGGGARAHTLRGAIAAAASNRDRSDTIVLSQGNYQVTAQVANDELAVTGGNLTIVGQGHSRVTINAVSFASVFHVLPGAQLTLKNLMITGGGVAIFGSSGGGIFNEGTLRLINCGVQGNSANLNGAGICNSGHMTMDDSVVANNYCSSGLGSDGGGIFNTGELTANRCVVRNNVSGTGLDGGLIGDVIGGIDGGNGGGICNIGSMILNNCSILENSTGAGGGGSFGGAGGGVIIGTGVGAGNGTDGGVGGSGGGIYNAGSLILNHAIIGGNSCGDGGSGSAAGVGGSGGNGGAGGSGGGVFNAEGSNVHSYNSLFTFNAVGIGGGWGAGYPPGPDGSVGGDGSGPDLFGGYISTGYNLVRAGDDSVGFMNGISHDIVGTIAVPANPQLYKFKR